MTEGLEHFKKIFILAIDGLEIKLVERYRLKCLKQKIYAGVDVSEFNPVLTPIIWASFITGNLPVEHGIRSWWQVSENKFVDLIIHKIKYKFPGMKKITPSFLRKMGRVLGLRERTFEKQYFQRMHLSTIFDYASSPVALFIPAYSESTETRIRYSDALEKGVLSYEKELWRTHTQRVNTLFRKLSLDWDLFMVWLDIADQIGHIYDYSTSRGRIKFMQVYFTLNKLVEDIKKELNKDTLFFVVSDHGTDLSPRGHHSNTAFFSANKDINWKPKSILDYAPFIKSVLIHAKNRLD